MNITDPIADMLTRIRNANNAKFKTVDVPASKMKKAIADVLLEEGYIKAFDEIDDGVQGILRITLKYDEKGNKVIAGLRRISKPGLRIYAGKDELPKADIAASFQKTMADTLIKKTKKIADSLNCKMIVLAGGVAANSELRKRLKELSEKGYNTNAPAMKYCTDNAAMVASSAYFNPIKCEDSLMLEVFSRS